VGVPREERRDHRPPRARGRPRGPPGGAACRARRRPAPLPRRRRPAPPRARGAPTRRARSPAWVRWTLRVVRSTSVTPSCASSFRSVWLTADALTSRRSPAARNPRASATAAKTAIAFRSSVIVKECFTGRAALSSTSRRPTATAALPPSWIGSSAGSRPIGSSRR
jgi:hypothetical protein